MYNIHVGLPNILPGLIERVSRELSCLGVRHRTVIPRRAWQDQFRGYINSSAKISVSPPHDMLFDFLSAANKEPSATLSIHDFLGTAEHCFSKAITMPYAAKRVERLTSLMNGLPITLHFVVVNQLDYVSANLSQSHDIAKTAISTPSWHDLIQRASYVSAGAELVVWEFDDPRKILTLFVMEMLNIWDEFSIEIVQDLICRDPSAAKLINMVLPHHDFQAGFASYSDVFDAQYDVDISGLISMGGVRVVRSNQVPLYLHLPHGQ